MSGELKLARLAWLVAALAVLGVGAWWLAGHGPASLPLMCILNKTTGLQCPGCGMTRAAHAFFEGRFADAFGFNPLGVLLLPLGLLGLGLEAQGWIYGTKPRWRIPLGRYGAVTLAVLVIAFTVLRNLPWWPFTLLAP